MSNIYNMIEEQNRDLDEPDDFCPYIDTPVVCNTKNCKFCKLYKAK